MKTDTPETDTEIIPCITRMQVGEFLDFARDMERQRNALRAFAQEIMEAHPEGDIDGGHLQELAEKHGLLAEVTATEPCGEWCHCAECSAEWPCKCFRSTPMLTGKTP